MIWSAFEHFRMSRMSFTHNFSLVWPDASEVPAPLHQVGEVQHQLPLDLMLVHFRPHLCHGYTDQYHSCNRSRVQWSLNRVEFWSTLEHLCFILFISLAKVIHFFGKFIIFTRLTTCLFAIGATPKETQLNCHRGAVKELFLRYQNTIQFLHMLR